MSFLLFSGLYLPTSFGETPSKLLWFIGIAVYGLLLFLLLIRDHTENREMYPLAGLIVALPLLFSFTSGLNDLTLGALAPYAIAALMFLVRGERLVLGKWPKRLFAGANILNLLVGVAILAGNERTQDFVSAHYSAIYPELVPMMVKLHKPVFMFASHSIAGFMWYLFFYANLRTFQVQKRPIYLFICLGYLVLMGGLTSVTGLLLCGVGIAHLALTLWSAGYRKTTLACATVLATIGFALGPLLADMTDVILSSPENGIYGRYTSSGTVHEALVFLQEHPMRPIGASDRASGLMTGDSAPVTYLLRGSVPFLLLMYGFYFVFLRRNLRLRADMTFLFWLTVAFQFGIDILSYPRFICLLPFACCYLNTLPTSVTNSVPASVA